MLSRAEIDDRAAWIDSGDIPRGDYDDEYAALETAQQLMAWLEAKAYPTFILGKRGIEQVVDGVPGEAYAWLEGRS